MQPLTERDIRASFVNTTKGETKRLAVPADLAERPWGDLDFLGWRDPKSPQRAYLVAESGGELLGVAMRLAAPAAGQSRRSMCSLCLTTHGPGGVSLMTAAKAGRSGQHGNSVGTYICADLACSLYLRGKKSAGPATRFQESLSEQEKIERTEGKVAAFLASVTT